MALLAEMVVNRNVYRSEFLEGLHPPKPLHGPFSPSEGEVAVLGPIVEPTASLLDIGGADLLQSGGV